MADLDRLAYTLAGSVPVIYHGELVAIAGKRRCHIIKPEMPESDVKVILVMCRLIAALPASQADPAMASQRAEAYASRIVRASAGGPPRPSPRAGSPGLRRGQST